MTSPAPRYTNQEKRCPVAVSVVKRPGDRGLEAGIELARGFPGFRTLLHREQDGIAGLCARRE